MNTFIGDMKDRFRYQSVITLPIVIVQLGLLYETVMLGAAGYPLKKDQLDNMICNYFDVTTFVCDDDLKKLSQLQILFECAFVHAVSFRPENLQLQWDMTTLLHHYPDFDRESEAEKERLLKFRNAMKIAIVVLGTAHRQKARLMIIAGRLEGTEEKYITGTGQSAATSRRVLIYEREGKTRAEVRLPRLRKKRSIDVADDLSAPISNKKRYLPMNHIAIAEDAPVAVPVEDAGEDFAALWNYLGFNFDAELV